MTAFFDGRSVVNTAMYLYNKLCHLMTDILENKTNLRYTNLGSQQVIMVIFEFLISEVIPPVHRNQTINTT